jgi:hypothetical protein
MDLQLAPSTIFRLDLPANLRLSPSINLPALPSNLTSDSHRLLHPPAQPSDLSSLRLRSIIQPNLPTSLQLAPLIDLPAQPLRQPATCAAGLFSD